jgi:hypothetical protein
MEARSSSTVLRSSVLPHNAIASRYSYRQCAAEPYKVISAVPSIAALIQEIATSPDPKHHPLLQQINQFLTESLLPVA